MDAVCCNTDMWVCSFGYSEPASCLWDICSRSQKEKKRGKKAYLPWGINIIFMPDQCVSTGLKWGWRHFLRNVCFELSIPDILASPDLNQNFYIWIQVKKWSRKAFQHLISLRRISRNVQHVSSNGSVSSVDWFLFNRLLETQSTLHNIHTATHKLLLYSSAFIFLTFSLWWMHQG